MRGIVSTVAAVFLLSGCIPDSDAPPPPTTAADLASLEVSAGPLSPAFAGPNANYTVSTGNATTTTMVKAVPVESDATIRINNEPAQAGQTFGPIPLNVGQNPISIVVTPKSSPPKSYTVTVIRSANVNLSNLVFSAGPLSPPFSPDTVNYTVAAPNLPGQTTITATAEQQGSTISIGGAPVASGQAFGPLPLNVGPNTFTILIRGSDTISTKEYTVVVNRAASSNANLAGLQVVPGTMAPLFSPATVAYQVTNVGLFTPAVSVAATAADPTATLTINGQAVGSGQAVQIPLPNVGATSIAVAVRAQDTVTVRSYGIQVFRCPGVGTC